MEVQRTGELSNSKSRWDHHQKKNEMNDCIIDLSEEKSIDNIYKSQEQGLQSRDTFTGNIQEQERQIRHWKTQSRKWDSLDMRN